MHIWPEGVLAQIHKGPGDWRASVPDIVAREIIARCMFGFCSQR
jgi:hypothetical protein